MTVGQFLQRRRVALGWVFGAVFAYLASPSPSSLAAGAVLLAAGAAVRTWASGHIRKQEELAVTGPYGHTRNPLYLGSFVMALGALVMARSAAAAALFALTAVPLYLTVMRREEEFLEGRFGDSFRRYRREVPLFFPRLTPYTAERGTFDPRLLRRHKEWRAWAGAAAVTLLLALKYYWS